MKGVSRTSPSRSTPSSASPAHSRSLSVSWCRVKVLIRGVLSGQEWQAWGESAGSEHSQVTGPWSISGRIELKRGIGGEHRPLQLLQARRGVEPQLPAEQGAQPVVRLQGAAAAAAAVERQDELAVQALLGGEA